MSARAGNRKSFIGEQTLDFQDQVNVFLAIGAPAVRAFFRFKHREFGFPVAQDKGFDPGHSADRADAVKLAFDIGRSLRASAIVCHFILSSLNRSRFKSEEHTSELQSHSFISYAV